MRRSGWWLTRPPLAVILAVLSAWGGIACQRRPVGASDFRRHEARYRAAVDLAREALAATGEGETARLRTEWEFDPVAGPEDTNVCAARGREGRLIVRILAYDRHHAGAFGYLYVDDGLRDADLERLLDDSGCGEWTIVDPVGPGWWAVENLLG